ncbi:MAG: hypothetical protein Q7O66_15205 [Dehalococcoidia bacterium]|nr:hypothetical protein [Dehalococcoidia bacterium]
MDERWQRRERKLLRQKKEIIESGRGLKTVIIPIIDKKAKEASKKVSES